MPNLSPIDNTWHEYTAAYGVVSVLARQSLFDQFIEAQGIPSDCVLRIDTIGDARRHFHGVLSLRLLIVLEDVAEQSANFVPDMIAAWEEHHGHAQWLATGFITGALRGICPFGMKRAECFRCIRSARKCPILSFTAAIAPLI